MGNYLEQEMVINSAWINVDDVRKLIPVGITKAKEIMKEITTEMRMSNEFYFKTRPVLIPSRKIIEKYNIDVNLIRKEANRIRRESK